MLFVARRVNAQQTIPGVPVMRCLWPVESSLGLEKSAIRVLMSPPVAVVLPVPAAPIKTQDWTEAREMNCDCFSL